MGFLTASALFKSRRNCGGSVAFVVRSIDVGAHHRTGQHMAYKLTADRGQSLRATSALIFAGCLLLAPAILSSSASAQVLGYASPPQSSFPSNHMMVAPGQPAPLSDEGDGSSSVVSERLRRAGITFDTREQPGTVVMDTSNTALYYLLRRGPALPYRPAVTRSSFPRTRV